MGVILSRYTGPESKQLSITTRAKARVTLNIQHRLWSYCYVGNQSIVSMSPPLPYITLSSKAISWAATHRLLFTVGCLK